MPYQTGTVANPADLKTTIETFAVARGWSLSSGVLSKGGSYIRLSAPDGDTVAIEASFDNFSSQAPHAPRIYIPSGWPATYHLFGFTDVDNIYCVLNYNVSRHQYIAFGKLLKYGTWTGGTWASATFPQLVTTMPGVGVIGTPPALTGAFYGGSPPGRTGGAIQCSSDSGAVGTANRHNSIMHAEIDGNIWGAPSHDEFRISCSSMTGNLINRLPNAWNSQTLLLPYQMIATRPSDYRSLIGELPHIRACRVDNHESGDVITIGAESWKIFPWLEKNSVQRNGSGGSGHSGTAGWAIKYDGP